MHIEVPAYAKYILDVLEEGGAEAWFVGGFVRDALLNRACSDIDIATNVSWQKVKNICKAAGLRTRETGIQHGTITVIVGKDTPESAGECAGAEEGARENTSESAAELKGANSKSAGAIEVTTYRTDGTYTDSRRPNEVFPVRTIEEDLARRDFTINALAWHPTRGLVDPYGGKADLDARLIRTVGNANERFSEDALRVLRACRFASQLGFSIEKETYTALLENKHKLQKISAERITDELNAFLLGEHVHDALMNCVDVLSFVLPELASVKGFEHHSHYHIYDVLEHIAWAVQYAAPNKLVRWAALFHDLGKPGSYFMRYDANVEVAENPAGEGHFYGHPYISEQLARGALLRFSLSPAFREKVCILVRYHDDEIAPTSKSVKRVLARLGGDVDLFRALCQLKRADITAHAPYFAQRVYIVDELESTLARILENEEAFSLKDLAIDGNDVIALGVSPGPLVGKALEAALDAVIEESEENTHENLCAFAKNWLANNAE